jgi:hypothetical protein
MHLMHGPIVGTQQNSNSPHAGAEQQHPYKSSKRNNNPSTLDYQQA